jgi:hypothetical protein
MKCKKCDGTGYISHYVCHGDHFGSGPSYDEWVDKPCPDCAKEKQPTVKELTSKIDKLQKEIDNLKALKVAK